MQFLHSKNVIHRDLKPENVLLTKDDSVRVMDFGLSKLVQDGSKTKTVRVGTSVYMAPEVVLGGHYDEKADCFSFGLLSYVVLTEQTSPFDVESTFNLEMKIAQNPSFRPSFEKFSGMGIPKEIVSLCEISWSSEPENRKPFDDITKELKMIISSSSCGDGLENKFEEIFSRFSEKELVILKQKLNDRFSN